MAPIHPNKSLIEGTVLAITPLADGSGSTLSIKVEKSQSLEGPHFTAAYVGKNLDVFVRASAAMAASVGASVSLTVVMNGDARGMLCIFVGDRIVGSFS